MSDYYWPRSCITNLHKLYITQIRYSIHQDDDCCCIKYTNILDEEPPQEHTFVPTFYMDHIKRFFWRHYLVITLYEYYEEKKLPEYMQSFLPYLLKVIVHMDNVIESIIRPCQAIARSEMKNHRFRAFDDYVITEYIIGRHDPDIMDDYRDIAMFNIEQLLLPHDSGEYYDIFQRILFVHLPVWNNEYAQRLPPLLSGSSYDYDINRVPKKDYETLFKGLFEWYTKKLDMEWCKYCLRSYYPFISYPYMTVKSTGTLAAEGEGIDDENQHEEGAGAGAGTGIGDKRSVSVSILVTKSSRQKQSHESNNQSNRPPKTPCDIPIPISDEEYYEACPSHTV